MWGQAFLAFIMKWFSSNQKWNFCLGRNFFGRQLVSGKVSQGVIPESVPKTCPAKDMALPAYFWTKAAHLWGSGTLLQNTGPDKTSTASFWKAGFWKTLLISIIDCEHDMQSLIMRPQRAGLPEQMRIEKFGCLKMAWAMFGQYSSTCWVHIASPSQTRSLKNSNSIFIIPGKTRTAPNFFIKALQLLHSWPLTTMRKEATMKAVVMMTRFIFSLIAKVPRVRESLYLGLVTMHQ